ncbi:proton-conducting transporter membrane subunit [Neisseria subflava]|uniref:proton-conducting transporter transmembrane domain-containing protein n=1 Tax=Neisseria subflava TaxID=28449 RepID=UPI0020B7DA2B|nr:proton-conducting transporter membrane subunit [Neisseria subflava]
MQTNIKRMLAYSTVSHMGFILLRLCRRGRFYRRFVLRHYLCFDGDSQLRCFDGIVHQDIECENIKDLAGLNQRHAWFAFLMLLSMFSMAGIPPLMGFYAKFGMIMALLKQGYVWLSVFAVIMSLIGAFYYLRVVKVIYFDALTMTGRSAATMPPNCPDVNAFLLLLWGIMPQTVIDWLPKHWKIPCKLQTKTNGGCSKAAVFVRIRIRMKYTQSSDGLKPLNNHQAGIIKILNIPRIMMGKNAHLTC